MHLDVVRLRDFYASRLGAVTARLIGNAIRELWPTVGGLSVLGLGYATPYLGGFLDSRSGSQPAERVIALMPATQGVHPWPVRRNASGQNRSLSHRRGNLAGLTHEYALPLADESIDRILLVHSLETTDLTQLLLREVWRVLAPGGRILVIVPNRGGTWTFSERTPFGQGRPFSRPQLEDTLKDHLFTPTTRGSALFFPPFASHSGLRALLAAEAPGRRWWRGLGGVLLMEAEKRMYALDPSLRQRAALKRRPVIAAHHRRDLK